MKTFMREGYSGTIKYISLGLGGTANKKQINWDYLTLLLALQNQWPCPYLIQASYI
jgi:hypothetical protein